MRAYERFLNYISFDTQSDEKSTTFPSTAKQLKLAEHLRDELKAIGAEDATLDENGYVSVYKMAFDMNIDVETSGIVVGTEASVEMEITFKNPGTAVTITPPEGYQDFPEVDLDALM